MMISETIAAKFDESVGQLTEVADKLTASIQAGNKEKARAFLEDLLNAQPKLNINITVPISENRQRMQEIEFSVRVHVEDREAAGGVFIMKVRSCDTIFDLKRKFLLQYDLPIEVQRWIIGKRIRDDICSLYSCGVKGPGATLFLYIVTAHSVGLTREAFEANRTAYVEGRFPLPLNPQLSTSSDGSLLASTLEKVIGKPSSPGVNSPFLDSQFPPDNSEKSNAFMTSSWTSQEPTDVGVGFLDPIRHPIVTSTINSSLLTRQNGDSGIDCEYSPENSSQLPTPSLVTANAPRISPLPEEPEGIGWNCPTCTFHNLPTRPGCAMCSTSRPESYEIPAGYQMTPEEQIRKAVDDEMERKTREPGLLGLSYDQEQDNLLLHLTQEGIDPQQFQFLEVDEEGFQILPQSILHEQSCNSISSNLDSVVARGPSQMQGPQLESSNVENLLDSDGEDENCSGDSSKA